MPTAKHHKTATIKQVTALKLLNEVDPETKKPFTKRKAMLRAGYSKAMANNPKLLMNSQAITNIVDRFQLELKDNGITTAYLAQKYAQWLDATKSVGLKLKDEDKDGKPTTTIVPLEVPDYQIQIEAGKLLKDVFSLTPDKKPANEGVTERVTLERFVWGDKPAQSS